MSRVPLNMRVSPDLDDLISLEAKRARRSKSAIAEDLMDESLKARRFPGIAFRGNGSDRRAWVIGTALDVWQIIEAYQDFDSAEQMVAESDLNEGQLRLALAYYEQFPEEIDGAIAENKLSVEELSKQYPTIEVFTVRT